MSTITTRAGKGLPLTNTELDANFTNLNNEKVETSEVVTTAAANKLLKLDASGNLPTGITGNAATATTLQTARTIGGVSFDGSASINLPGVNTAGNQNTTGSAAKWTTARTLSYTGDATGSGSVDGSANVATALTLANSGVTAGTYTKVTVDAKGRATSGTTLAAADIPALDASKITSGVLDAARLPSYVDDVLEYANLAGFPATGETGKIYVDLSTNKTHRWSGSAYVEISASPGSTDSVTEGSVNLYFTASRVLNSVLSGLSTATNAVISATDSVLTALGKLQAQITANLSTLTTHTGNTINPHGTTAAQVGLGSVENKSSATIRSEITSANVTTALGFTPISGSGSTTGASGSIANTGGWSVTPTGTKLYFSYNGVNVASLDSSGNLIAKANITGYGTP